jgi:hypothetical protein
MIPAEVTLGSRTWKIKRGVRMKALGDCDGSRCVIRLSRKNKSPEEEWHTFCHELTHAICFSMGWSEFNDDEIKIDAFANLLAQALATALHK